MRRGGGTEINIIRINGHAGWSRKEIPIMNVIAHAAGWEERN